MHFNWYRNNALTPEELRQRIPTWSLESDGNLLQYMISIAKNLEEKCTKTRDNLNSLMLQVDQTELKLSNATNQFSAVEQVKFVENRVEEDDESFYGLRRRRQQQQHLQQQADERKEVSNQGQDPERSLDDLIQLAVERSIEGMYKSYEKVTLQLTDSDTSDGEDASEGGTRMTEADLSGGKASIMRAVPRHPFIDRPLPHVIGTREWQNKWHVGLIDSDDESSSERKEEYSESSSASDDDDDGGMFPSQPNSKNHTPSESESSIWGTDAVGRKRAPSMDPSITGDDGSSVYSYASSSKPRALPNSLPVRGMLPIGASSLKPPSLFPEEPPPEQVVDDVKKRSDKGLFDESPEEEEEVEPAPLPTPRQTVPHSNATVPFFKGAVNQPARKTVNLFDDEPPSPRQQRGPLMPEPKKPINLFIESDDDEEERKENTRNNNNVPDEAVARNVKPTAGQPVTNPRTMTKLVDELNNNFRKQSGPTVRARNPEQRSSVGSQLFDAEPPVDDFDQLFNAAKPPTSQSALPPQPAFRTVVEKKTVNLFADDDDDDDDGIVVGSNEKQPIARSPFISPIRIEPLKQAERKKKSIFDESDSDVENDNVGPIVEVQRNAKMPSEIIPAKAPQLPKAITKSIFSDSSEAEEDDEDALFGHSSNVVKSKLDALKRNGANSVPTVATVAPVAQQTATKNPPDGKKMAKKSLFDEESDDDEGEDSLFSSKPSVTGRTSSTVVPTAQKTTAAKVSLFDDLSPTEDDRPPVDRIRSSTSIPSKMSTSEDLFGPGIETKTPERITNSTESVAVKPSILEPAPTQAEVVSERIPIAVDPLNVVRESTVPNISEPPVGGSIRSLIMKKSIFNSDSESEEDDSIFGPSGISISAERASENVPDGLNTKAETEKCDTDGAQLDPGPRHSDVDESNGKEVEIESIPHPTPPNGTGSREGEQEKPLPANLLDDNSTKTAKKPDIKDPDIFGFSEKSSTSRNHSKRNRKPCARGC
ncbi:AGAP007833-PA-like protein [Anopheles sinensis]|uniref:AGAP007833-PA-like protein n=1 Tax=Anopheles sinensis TaxID=74873 RepID=A0A084VUJ4_ANOSI|nr:AGAP007833-PA-like protein [Anopheles sinensis]